VERAACPINRTKEETKGERMQGKRHGTAEEKGTATCREIRWPSRGSVGDAASVQVAARVDGAGRGAPVPWLVFCWRSRAAAAGG
jgi:hypothetical protein